MSGDPWRIASRNICGAPDCIYYQSSHPYTGTLAHTYPDGEPAGDRKFCPNDPCYGNPGHKGECFPLPASGGHDPIGHPKHYVSHASGVECIQVTEHMNFCLGNAVKYLWRAGLKADAVEDLKKAAWYIEREIARIQCQSE